MKNRVTAAIVAVLLFTSLVVACSWGQPACADTLSSSDVITRTGGGSSSGGGSSGGGRSSSGGGSSSGGARSGGGSSSGGSKSGGGSSSGGGSTGGSKSAPQAKPSPGQTSTGGAKTVNGKPTSSVGASKTTTQAAASKGSKPGAPVDAAASAKAKSEAPKSVSRNSVYTSSVTNNTYVYHSRGYYLGMGYPWSIYDPFNPYNYWYHPYGMPLSPFYGMPYRYAAACGGQEKEIKAQSENNINITIDQNGKVTKAEDKNTYDKDIDEKVEADDNPPVADDAPADPADATTTTAGG